jgi:hypothetical protein
MGAARSPAMIMAASPRMHVIYRCRRKWRKTCRVLAGWMTPKTTLIRNSFMRVSRQPRVRLDWKIERAPGEDPEPGPQSFTIRFLQELGNAQDLRPRILLNNDRCNLRIVRIGWVRFSSGVRKGLIVIAPKQHYAGLYLYFWVCRAREILCLGNI